MLVKPWHTLTEACLLIISYVSANAWCIFQTKWKMVEFDLSPYAHMIIKKMCKDDILGLKMGYLEIKVSNSNKSHFSC